MKQGRGARNHIIYFSKGGKTANKKSSCNLLSALLHLVTINSSQMHTLPEKLNAAYENNVHQYIKGRGRGFGVECYPTVLPCKLLPKSGKDRGKHRWGFLPWRISHKIVIHKTQSMPEAKHLLLRDVPTLPLDKSCWQGWLSRGHISLDARISPQLSFNSMADFNQGLLITLKCHKQPTFAIMFLDCYQNLSDIIHTMQKID